jgi:NAD(P)-dependent dehydrogenase (short-subunit alcohol dehydrogenase family)
MRQRGHGPGPARARRRTRRGLPDVDRGYPDRTYDRFGSATIADGVEVAGTTALVTGAGGGIGRGTCRRLAAQGARVLAVDIDAEAAEAIAADIGGDSAFHVADVTSEADVAEMIERAGPSLGVVVNNAGGYSSPVFPDASVEHWSRALELNLRSVMLVTHYAVRVLEPHGGAIVNIASSAGLGLAPYGAPEYAAAKAAVMRLTASLASLSDRGIHVTCICPHTVATPAVLDRIAELDARGEERSPDLRGQLIAVDEVVDAVMGTVRDDTLAGRVLVLQGGRPPRLLPNNDPLG